MGCFDESKLRVGCQIPIIGSKAHGEPFPWVSPTANDLRPLWGRPADDTVRIWEAAHRGEPICAEAGRPFPSLSGRQAPAPPASDLNAAPRLPLT